MADYEEDIPAEEKVKIASDFILNAPPGEFNEVFNDVRVLLADDVLLKEGAADAFVQYNEENFTPAAMEGSEQKVLITPFGRQPDGRYVDPRSKQVFSFDHLRKEISGAQAAGAAAGDEGLRAAVEAAADEYIADHYHTGTVTVYSHEGSIVVCIEDHKYQPHNFWNGRWRSQWTMDASGSVAGKLWVHVHYYEDGNVQLQSNKDVDGSVQVGDAGATAKALFKLILNSENEYQTAISENYNAMSDTTFKALRRALPITRSKVDWHKILNYKIGKELKK
jgi:capping protein alpha